MLSSNYRDKCPCNAYYRKYFAGGDPVRKPGENPLVDPVRYWPYVLPVYRLFAPEGLVVKGLGG